MTGLGRHSGGGSAPRNVRPGLLETDRDKAPVVHGNHEGVLPIRPCPLRLLRRAAAEDRAASHDCGADRVNHELHCVTLALVARVIVFLAAYLAIEVDPSRVTAEGVVRRVDAFV